MSVSLDGQLQQGAFPAHTWQYLTCLLFPRLQLCFLMERSWEM